MGLLSQILGGLAGNVLGRSPLGRTSSGGTNRVMMALLPVVLSMLANRQGGRMMGQSLANTGGTGFGGLGGLGGLLERFTQQGYGQQAQSWVSTGPNEPIPPNALSDVLGASQISEIAAQAGVSEDEARTGLSQLLPEVVDHFTPSGQMPDENELSTSIDDYERQLPR